MKVSTSLRRTSSIPDRILCWRGLSPRLARVESRPGAVRQWAEFYLVFVYMISRRFINCPYLFVQVSTG